MNFKTAVVRATSVSALIFANSIFLAAQGVSSDSIYQLPAGTRIRLKMDVELSSKVATSNDTFTTAVARAVTIRDTIVLPVGTVIEGRVRAASPAASGENGKLDITFESLKLLNTPPRRIDAELVKRFEAPSRTRANLLTILGGTLVGAFVGASARGASGTAIGAGVGAGGGTAVALLRKGKNVRIREDQEFEIELKKEVVLPVLDY